MSDLKDAGSTTRLAHRPALDGVRAVAVLGVIGFHLNFPLLKGGLLGVDLFFALSGFLITTLLLEEWGGNGRISLRRFYGRRALRLFPALMLLLAAVAVYTAFGFGNRGEDSLGIVASLFYVANWVRAAGHDHTLAILGHTWSLSVEEQFYLVWPLVLIIVSRRWGRRGVACAAVAGAIAAFVFRAVLWQGPVSIPRVYNGTDTVADQLLWGCAVAAAIGVWGPQMRRFLATMFWPAAAYLAFAFAFGSGLNGRFYPVVYAGLAVAGAVVVGAVATVPDDTVRRVLSIAPLTWVGRVSYGLYLWHYAVLGMLGGEVASNRGPVSQGPAHALATAALTFAAATTSYYLVERPLQRRFRARFAVAKPEAEPDAIAMAPAP